FLSVSGGGATLASLKSEGQALVYTLSGDGTQLTARAGSAEGNLVFTVKLSDEGNGSYEFDLDGVLDHPVKASGAQNEDVLSFRFTFTARDGDGDVAESGFTVKIIDDSPVQTGDGNHNAPLDEDDVAAIVNVQPAGTDRNQPQSLSGQISKVNFGADGFGSLAFSGAFSVPNENSGVLVVNENAGAESGLTSDGDPVYLRLVNDGRTIEGFVPDREGEVVFRAILNGTDRGYTVNLLGNIDHQPGAEGRGDAQSLNFDVRATDGDGDYVDVNMSIRIRDDAPVVSNPAGVAPGVSNASMQENDIAAILGVQGAGTDGAQPPSASGNLLVNFGADGFGSTAFSGGFNVPNAGSGILVAGDLNGVDSGLKSDGVTVMFRLSADGQVIEGYKFGSNEVVLRAQLDQNDAGWTVDLLGNIDHQPGDSGRGAGQSVNFTVTAKDGDGDPLDVTLSVRINDDSPVFDDNARSEVSEDGSKTVTASLNGLDWGADDGAARSLTISTAVGVKDHTNAEVNELRSNEKVVSFTLVSGVLVAYVDAKPESIDATNVVFTVTPDASTGSYTFDLRQPLDHTSPVGTDQHIDLDFTVTATDSDGDPATGSFTVRVDAAGTIGSINYSDLDTGVFVNLSEASENRSGQTVAANTATDRTGANIVGVDGMAGVNDAFGSSVADILVGGAEANVLKGNEGDDILIGGKGSDTLDGGDDDDTLIVSADIDVVNGYGPRTFTRGDGTSEDVSINGRSGEGDTLIGGSGFDTVRFEPASGANGFVFDRANASLGLSGVEKFVGTDGDDIILLPNAYTTSDSPLIEIEGGKGNDVLQGSNAQGDKISGGDGSDAISGLGGDDDISGGNGDDRIWGGEGNDLIRGDWGKDTIYGGNGNDTIYGGGDDDVLDGGAGNDALDGGDGNDVLTGGTGTNSLFGGKGNDVLGGDSATQTTAFDGGEGIDTLHVKSPGSKVTVNLATGTITGGHYNGSTVVGIENVENKSPNSAVEFIGDNADNILIGGNKDDVLSGGAGDDLLRGGDGNDALTGGTGTNSLFGGKGNDVLGGDSATQTTAFDGGEGIDTLHVKSPGSKVTVNLATGTITGGHYNGSTVVGIENVENKSPNSAVEFIGDNADNILIGGNKDDVLSGGAGDDLLRGGDGNDVLTGGTGTNSLFGGKGNDVLGGDSATQTTAFDGGEGIDTLHVKSPGSKVTVNLSTGTITGGHYDGSTVVGIENVENKSPNSAVEFIGNDADNILIGGNKDDVLSGGAGDDTLDGGSGADRLAGGGGSDTMIGGGDNDQFFINGGNDTIFGNATDLTVDANRLAARGESDTVIVYGAQSDYAVTRDLDGSWTITSASETDKLYGIEGINFDGGQLVELDLTANVLVFNAASQLVGTFATIQQGVNFADAGFTVEVREGTYNEAVVIGEGITLKGVGTVIVDGGEAGPAITVNGGGAGRSLLIDGIDLKSASSSVILIAKTAEYDSVSLKNAEVTGGDYHGLFVENAVNVDGLTVENVSFSGNATVESGGAGEGPITIFLYNGNVTFKNVDVKDPGAAAENGIQLRGVDAPFQPMGTVVFDNVDVSGTYSKVGVAIYNFTNANGLQIVSGGLDVNVNAKWHGLNIDNVGGTIDLSGVPLTVVNSFAGPSNDIAIQGTSGNETFTGDDSDDLLFGKGGGDRLNGGAGNDIFVLAGDVTGSGTRNIQLGDGSVRAVSIAGLAGTSDIVSGGSGGDSIVLNRGATPGFVHDTDSAPSFMSGIEAINGTDGRDVIIVNDTYMSDAVGGGILISGNAGNDVLGGGAGSDTIYGGDNDDLISGLGGNDTLDGGAGNDEIWGGAGNDTLIGGGDNDQFFINGGNDTVYGNATDLTVTSNRLATAGESDATVVYGNQADYAVTRNSDGSWTISSAGETDTLYGVEHINFNGGQVELDLTANVLVFNASGELVGTYNTIQEGVDNSLNGFTIEVLPGTYNENVTIGVSITLVSVGGRDSTIINGVSTGSENATITVLGGIDNVSIGTNGNDGFTIVGFDKGNPGIEQAAVYLLNAVAGNPTDNFHMVGNEVVANGEAALLSDWNAAVTNAVIDRNIFSGKTFVGAEPATGDQFTVPNVARQLVAFGQGSTPASNNADNITFTNNAITGAAGGTSAGNNLVTIDASNSNISNNIFTGHTAGGSFALRARGEGTSIENNTLDHSAGGNSAGISVNNHGMPGTYLGNEVIGGSGDDAIFGMTPGADLISGNGGNDILAAGDGDDTIYGGQGSDAIYGQGGNDTLEGGDGHDIIDGGAGQDVLRGGKGDDVIRGGADNDRIGGKEGNDTIHGDAGADEIWGDAGDDTIVWNVGDGADQISGGSNTAVGDTLQVRATGAGQTISLEKPAVGSGFKVSEAASTDVVSVSGVEEVEVDFTAGAGTLNIVGDFAGSGININTISVEGGAGNDSVDASLMSGTSPNSKVGIDFNGNGGNDTFKSGVGDDVFNGGDGDDTFYAGAGRDIFDGGSGDDRIVLAGASTDYTVTFNPDGTVSIQNNGSSDVTTVDMNVETVSFAGGGDPITINPVSVFDSLNVYRGSFATIQEAISNGATVDGDVIVVASGRYDEDLTITKAITIRGANFGVAGSDEERGGETTIDGTVTVSTAVGSVVIDGVEVRNSSNNATPFNGLTVTGAANLSLMNSVFASASANGSDTDRAIYLTTAAIGAIVIQNNAFGGSFAEPGKYGTASWNRGIWSDGNASSLTITDNVFENVRTAMNLDSYDDATSNVSGNTIKNSGSGISVGVGSNSEILNIDDNSFSNVDTDFNLQNLTTDIVFSLNENHASDTMLVLGGSGDDSITGTTGIDALYGRAGADALFGLDGNDFLFGEGGNDILNGGLGLNTMTGGDGADTFVFDETAFSEFDVADVITDYNFVAGDALDVSALLDSLLGEDASDGDRLHAVATRNDGVNTFVSVTDEGVTKDIVMLNGVHDVKILYDDKHVPVVHD
ncbi:hypothetical protein H6M51_23515, partial [Rhizobium sp. AQ_MP]|nr:hypothetical protein [Rhizobium sp. AQ_MP]